MDRGDRQAIFSPGGYKKLDTTEHSHTHTHTHTHTHRVIRRRPISDYLTYWQPSIGTS